MLNAEGLHNNVLNNGQKSYIVKQQMMHLQRFSDIGDKQIDWI